ncbi:hypothetical protein [Pseudovibrio brasiliensis]|uniref:Uncharacterized protein n=1 Tax=Pseudovibrio brasiliensis TaxID=1898042 RepID=A0ABX8AVC7_9HYPH|nr:hypothetical protein [Pseudovibrio brasiliensis]QUS58983.1 hypothetical protein KGB56_24195 [Pseudovibrio brasiliensis]
METTLSSAEALWTKEKLKRLAAPKLSAINFLDKHISTISPETLIRKTRNSLISQIYSSMIEKARAYEVKLNTALPLLIL